MRSFSFFSKYSLQHLSLHFDGVRVSGGLPPDIPELCRECSDHVLSVTGFQINIRQKHHNFLIDEVRRLSSTIEPCKTLKDYYRKDGNCIPAAIKLIHGTPSAVDLALADDQAEENVRAATRRYRSYFKSAELCRVQLAATQGCDIRKPGKYLIHSEPSGRPHCNGAVIREGGADMVFYTCDEKITLSVTKFRQAVAASVDKQLLCTFEIVGGVEGANSDLLQLQAGAGICASESEADSDDGDARTSELEAEDVVHVGDELLSILEREVQTTKLSALAPEYRSRMQCPLCPFRYFGSNRGARWESHLVGYHTSLKQFCCSGTKQLKIVMALFNSDRTLGIASCSYLERSATILRNSVEPALDSGRNDIDRFIRLAFAGDGPIYRSVEWVEKERNLRRVGNILYTKEFADMVYQELILHESKVKAMLPRLYLRASLAGNELGSLYPSHCRHWWPIVEDIFASPPVQEKQSAHLESMLAREEFEVVSLDSTCKVTFSLCGQASWRAPAAIRRQAAISEEDSNRRVLTVRGRTGFVLLMAPMRSEAPLVIAETLRDCLSDRFLRQIRHIFIDDPKPVTFQDFSRVCPNLVSVSLDTTHLPIVYEYASYRKRTPGSRALRAIMCKFNRADTSKGSHSWGCVYHGWELRRLDDEEETMRRRILNSSMSAARARRVLTGLNCEVPFYSRVEFIESLAALSKMYADEMNKVATGTNKKLRTILYNAANSPRIEWYWNNIRIRHYVS